MNYILKDGKKSHKWRFSPKKKKNREGGRKVGREEEERDCANYMASEADLVSYVCVISIEITKIEITLTSFYNFCKDCRN